MVAIKDMVMPSSCINCNIRNGSYCYAKNKPPYNIKGNLLTRDDDCPLVEIEERKVGKCPDCNEYNQEKHYCPKFCDVIRDTTKEMQEFYKGEHEKLEKIEQIVNEWNDDIQACQKDLWMYLADIKEVLEQE